MLILKLAELNKLSLHADNMYQSEMFSVNLRAIL